MRASFSFDKLLAKLHHDRVNATANEESAALPVSASHREPSRAEKEACFAFQTQGLLFCCHSKSYFDVCQACKRTRAIATEHYRLFKRRYLKTDRFF